MYDVFLADNFNLFDRNIIRVTVTFPDNTSATAAFYVDNYGPEFMKCSAHWADGQTASLRVTSNESGTLYYLTANSKEGKNPNSDEVKKNGKSTPLSAGAGDYTLTVGEAGHDTIYFVGEDTSGNLSISTIKVEIEVKIEPKQADPGPAANETVSVTQPSDSAIPNT